VAQIKLISSVAVAAAIAIGLGGSADARDGSRAGGGWFGSLFSGSSQEGGTREVHPVSRPTELVDLGGSEWGHGFDPSSEAFSATFDTRQPTLSPRTADSIRNAIDDYRAIAARGGWGRVPADHVLQLGLNHPSVVALRQRLIATGDLSQHAGMSSTFDTYVDAAVRRFQARHGVLPDGVVGRETLHELNVPVEARIEQLQINLARVESTARDLGDRYIMVNIPGAEIETVQNDEVVSRHTAVVGKVDRPTPLLSSRIIEVNFNPYWHVPTSIVRRDIIPQMREDPEYLTRYNIRMYDQNGNELDPRNVDWYSEEATNYLLRQDPGDLNSLGSVRINFPNPHSVFLHDTPLQNLFGINDRLQSSGCVRIQNVRQLVTWLLEPNGDWSRAKVDAVIRSGERLDMRLRQPVSLHMTYITAWATGDGVVNFRADVYGRDGLGDASASAEL
jgi:L,D-transpeptidase YcbB